MDEKENLELNLEDIMKEFGSGQDETPDEELKEWTTKVFGEETPAEPAQETPDQAEEPEEPQVEEPAEPVTQATIRMDPIVVDEPAEEPNSVVVSDDTIRIDPIVTGDTIRIDPIVDEPETPVEEVTGDTIRLDTVKICEGVAANVTSDTIRLDTAVVAKAEVRNAQRIVDEEEEAFSDKWEPQYEQPMGEYVPAQQIIAHPRSRLRELKKKLVEGPEKRYYKLAESGFGKLQAAIFFSLVVVLISAATTALHAFNLISPNKMKLMIFGQILAMMVSALLGSNQLIDGVANVFRKRFSLNTLLSLTFVVCLVDGLFCLQEQRVPCCAAFSLEMTMSLWGAYQRRNTEMGQMDTMRKATHLESVVEQPDYYDGKKGFIRGKGEVEDFMETYNDLPRPAKTLDVYALIAALLSLSTGVVAFVLKGFSDIVPALSAGFQVFAVTLLAAVPVASFIAISRPMGVLERKLHQAGAVICGWRAVEKLCDKAAFPLCFEDLFPAGSCRMNGVKFFGSRDPDEIVSYCTALMEAENGGLAGLFTQVLDSRNAIRYTAHDLTRYDGGIGASVEGEQVLVGSLSFLKSMGVKTPEGVRVNQAVCVAIEGEFCGLFAVSLDRFKDAYEGMNAVCNQRGLTPVLTASDFVLTESFIRGKLKVNTKRLHLPDQEVRAALAQVEPSEEAKPLAIVTTEGLAPYAFAVAGARTLRSSTRAGVIISIIGGALGIAMMIALTLLGALHYLTPANMFLYQLVWLIPGLLITEWTRNP